MEPSDGRPPVSAYAVYVTPAALREIKNLPGHVRKRVRRAIDGFADTPRPPGSKRLDLPGPLREKGSFRA